MERTIKAYVADGPKEIANFLGDRIELIDNLDHAHFVIFASDKDVSPEYYGKRTKDESRHDPIKDKFIYDTLMSIRRKNPYCVVLGLCGSAGMIDAIYGGCGLQGQFIKKDTKVFLTRDRHSDFVYREGAWKMKFNTTESHYGYVSTYGYKAMVMHTGKKECNFVTVYSANTYMPRSISIHANPMHLADDCIFNDILKCTVLNAFQGTLPIAAHECNPTKLSDTSRWASESSLRGCSFSIEDRPCFGALVKNGLREIAAFNHKAEVSYLIEIHKPSSWTRCHGRNVTFFKFEEYKEYYDRLQKLYPFEYSVDESNENYVRINLKINACCLMHKFILTHIRYIYQYPMHYILCDALKLKKIEEFSSMDILDLLNIVAKTISSSVYESCEYMFHPYDYNDRWDTIIKPINDEEFRATVEKYASNHDRGMLNELSELFLVTTPEQMEYIKDTIPCFGNWEIFNKTFEVRLPFYSRNINIFKKIKV